jgi:hypothetical protein
MNETTRRPGPDSFVLGLFAGTFVGAGLAMWLAPRAAQNYRHVRIRVADVVDNLTRRGQEVRDDIAAAVAHGAHEVAHGASEVERLATAARRSRAVHATPSV